MPTPTSAAPVACATSTTASSLNGTSPSTPSAHPSRPDRSGRKPRRSQPYGLSPDTGPPPCGPHSTTYTPLSEPRAYRTSDFPFSPSSA
jgi:hypothetical protein